MASRSPNSFPALSPTDVLTNGEHLAKSTVFGLALIVACTVCAPTALAEKVAADQTYDQRVDQAAGHLDAGNHAQAVDIYRRLLVRQRAACALLPKVSRLSQLKKRSPCWRMMMMHFNIALARKRQSLHRETVDAFKSYLQEWRAKYPSFGAYPYEERAHFEIATAYWQARKFDQALQHYRQALARWRRRYVGKRARFTDGANRRIADCLRELGRRREAATAYRFFLDSYRNHHRAAHPDHAHIGERIARLQKPAPLAARPTATKRTQPAGAPPQRVVYAARPRPRSQRSAAWLVSSIASAALAGGAAAAAVVFTKKADEHWRGTPPYKDDRNLALAGYIVAGTFAIWATTSLVLYLRSGKVGEVGAERRAAASQLTRAIVVPLAGGAMAATRWRF